MKHLAGKAYKRVNKSLTTSLAVVCKDNAKLIFFDLTPVGVYVNWDYKGEQEAIDNDLEKYSQELKEGSLTSGQLFSIINLASGVNSLRADREAVQEAARIIERIILGDV